MIWGNLYMQMHFAHKPNSMILVSNLDMGPYCGGVVPHGNRVFTNSSMNFELAQ